MFPSESDLTICFAHIAYHLQRRFALRKLPIRNFWRWPGGCLRHAIIRSSMYGAA
jgi:hypothetical protein